MKTSYALLTVLALLCAQPSVAKDSDKELLRELKEFQHSIKEIKRMAHSLAGEFNRSNVQILEYDQYINDYIDDKPVPVDQDSLYAYGRGGGGNTGVVEGPPLPPRPQWVQKYDGDIAQLSSLTQAELQDVFKAGGRAIDPVTQNQIKALTASAARLSRTAASDPKAQVLPLVADLLDDSTQLELSIRRTVRQWLTDTHGHAP